MPQRPGVPIRSPRAVELIVRLDLHGRQIGHLRSLFRRGRRRLSTLAVHPQTNSSALSNGGISVYMSAFRIAHFIFQIGRAHEALPRLTLASCDP